jgi:hypothetical protein
MTERFNTGNPLGSTDARDGNDNAKNLDVAVNGLDPTWNDRFGRTRHTMFGLETNATAVVQAATEQADRAESEADDAATSAAIAAAAVSGSVNTFWAEDNAAAAGLAASLGDGATVITHNDETAEPAGVQTRRTVLGGVLQSVSSFLTSTMMAWQHGGFGSVLRTLYARLMDLPINANDFGFSPTGTASDNAAAILAAVDESNGKQVVVHSDVDFLMNSISFTDKNVRIDFTGKGKVNRTLGGARVLTATNTFQDILSVSSITKENFTVDGGTTSLWCLNVSDSSAYQRDDIVRVVSDDLDPDSAGGNRRYGEANIVIGTSSGKIFLANELEDGLAMTTAVRVGKYRTTVFDVRGLEVQSLITNEVGQIAVLEGLVRPRFELDVSQHGHIGVETRGCFQGEFYISGTGKGATTANLSYLINDVGGCQNTYVRPKGSFHRHTFTTGFNTTTAGSTALALFGGSRDIVVFEGKAFGAQGCPWDDHEGARRTKFIRCETRGMLQNTATARTAYQLRGKDCLVVDPVIDNTLNFLLRISNNSPAGSVHRVVGGRIKVPVAESSVTITSPQRVVLDSLECEISNVNAGCFGVSGQVEFVLNGGVYANTECTLGTRRLILSTSGTSYVFNNPLLSFGHVIGNSSTNNRPFSFVGSGDAHMTGQFRYKRTGQQSGVGYSGFFYTENTSAQLKVKADVSGTFAPNTVSGTFSYIKYAMSNSDGNNRTNIADFDDYMTHLVGI